MEELSSEGDHVFLQLYQMEYQSFMCLCDMIHSKVEVDKDMSRQRTGRGPITVETMLHCLLQWLGGGSYLDIRLSTGISTTSFYRCVYKCIDVILELEELSYTFSGGEALNSAAQAFESLSSNGALNRCVVCLDGYLLQIQIPASGETWNVKAYFSGHYQAYRINI